MTRINTNVSSLNAQKILGRSNANLQEALTRLSTGLRINAGKDDPAGLIASEVLRSDITSVERAITNSERANQMIATADSALGQVSSLLNDVRGLVSEAANTGAMSDEQIAANQLQLDSSLEAIDRIAQVTQFQGKRLLDGNLDFITEGVDASQLSGLQIDQANFGTLSEIDVSVDVVAQAETASLIYGSNTTSSDVVLEIGGTNGFEAFTFAAGSTVEEMAAAINLVSDALGVEAEVNSIVATEDGTGTVELTSVGDDNNVTVTADTTGRDGGDIAVKYVADGDGDTTAAWVDATGTSPATITVHVETSKWTAASGAAINLGSGTLDLAANSAGTKYNDLDLIIQDDAAGTAVYDDNLNTITVKADISNADIGAKEIQDIINADLGHLFTASNGTDNSTDVTANTYADVLANGVDGGVIAATGDDVLGAINDDVGTHVTATGGGTGTVTMIEDYAFYGTPNAGATSDTDDYIQLLGPSLSNLDVSFEAGAASQTLSVEFAENRDTLGYATATVQGANADASFSVSAKTTGTEYDDVTVRFTQSTTFSGVNWDAENGVLNIAADFNTGVTAATVKDAINNDAYVSTLFEAELLGGSAGGGNVDSVGAVQGDTGDMATTSGGNQYTGVTIKLATDADGNVTSTADDVVSYINDTSTELQNLGVSAANAGGSDGSGLVVPGSTAFATVGVTLSDSAATATTSNRGGENAQMTVTAKTAGSAYDGVQVVFRHDANIAGGTTDERITYDADAKQLNVYIDSGTSTLTNVLDNWSATDAAEAYALFEIEAVGTGGGTLYSTDSGVLSGGTTETGTSAGVSMTGAYDEGDVIGTGGLELTSVGYGSKEFVSVKALEGSFQTTDADGVVADRDTGSDVDLRINGIQAVADGLKVSLNTSVLDLSFTVGSSVAEGAEMNFSITDGGAQFQLGPDVVSNQQARLGIQSINTAKLGGATGRLYQLKSGQSYSLNENVMMAATVVEEAITQVTTLRGRLGAFQATTVDTNISALSDTLENLTEAESSIRDADFAEESANLTRAQILVQSGISVLGIANQNPQNVLGLLR